MPSYKAHPTKKSNPSRLQRKHERSVVFLENKGLTSKLRKERKLARRKAEQEAAELAELEAQIAEETQQSA